MYNYSGNGHLQNAKPLEFLSCSSHQNIVFPCPTNLYPAAHIQPHITYLLYIFITAIKENLNNNRNVTKTNRKSFGSAPISLSFVSFIRRVPES